MATLVNPSWLIADSNGALKLVSCTEAAADLKEPALKYTLEAQSVPTAVAKPIQRLAVGIHAGQNMVHLFVSLLCT